MFLSIVIPIWNDEKYLNECLDSCLNQELSKEDYEIICVDDGSTDRTPEILKNYAEQYPNIRVITKQHGPQHGSGRTIGLEAARGSYVWFVDHDDLVAPGAVDDLKKAADANPGLGRIQFPCYMFYDELTDNEKELFDSKKLNSNDGGFLKDMVVWSAIYAREFLQENDIHPLSSRKQQAKEYWQLEPFRIWAGDTVFVEECLDKGITTLELEGRPLYHYRRHDDSQSLEASPSAVRERAVRRRNFVLIWGYLIHLLEQQCQLERQTLGRAEPETVKKLIDRLRRCSTYMNNMPFKQWRSVVRLFSDKGLFLRRKPQEYPVTFRDYRKKLWKLEKYVPHLLAEYFTYTKAGTVIYRFLSWPLRTRRNNKRLEARKQEIKKERLLAVGTGKEI